MTPQISADTAGDPMPKPAAARRAQVIRAPSFSPRGLPGQLRELARYGDLIRTLCEHRIKVRYKQSALGILWAVLQPLSLMLIYTAVFSLVARVPSEGLPYSVFAYTALLPWTFFATALSNATNGLASHSQLVTKVYFPREILPLTYVGAALFDFALASLVLGGLILYHHVPLTANALYALPITLVLGLLVSAVALFFSALQARFRDLSVAVPLLLQLWMLATPVVYPLSAVPERWRGLYLLNPMAGLVDNFRRVILQGAAPEFYSLGVSTLITLLLLPLAYVHFKQVEVNLADII